VSETIANRENEASNSVYIREQGIKDIQQEDKRLSSHRNFLRSGCWLTSQVFSSLEFGSGYTSSFSFVAISCLVSILSPLHPSPRYGIRSELWHGILGNFVASFSCSTYRSAPHENLMTKQKLRNYVVLFGGVSVPRFHATKWLNFIRSPLRRRITYLYVQ